MTKAWGGLVDQKSLPMSRVTTVENLCMFINII